MAKKRGRPRKMVEDTAVASVAAVSEKPKKKGYIVLSSIREDGQVYASGDVYKGKSVERLLELGAIKEA